MASESLNKPVEIQAQRIDATLLPPGFSMPYQLYVIQQGTDVGNVANKANEAGAGAFDAQVKNDEQDLRLDDHEERIASAEQTLINHEERIQSAENTLVNHEERIAANELELADHEQRLSQAEQDITSVEGRLDDAESNITDLQQDYVSKSAVTQQSLASSLNVTTSYSINGQQVLAARIMGITAATGSYYAGAFDANLTLTAPAAYSQADLQSVIDAMVQARQRVKLLEDVMRYHGLIQ